MKKLYYAIMFLFILGLSNHTNVQAQKVDANDKSALLYEITGNGLETPSYIFGTIHIICTEDMISMNKLTDYVDKTEQVFLEVDLDDPSEMALAGKMAIMADDKTLSEIMSAEQYAKVDELVKSSVGVPLEALKTYKPMFVSVMAITSPKLLGCDQARSYDFSLLQYAVSKKKSVEGLETMKAQTAAIDSIPLKKQVEDLYKIALNPEKSLTEFKKMLDIYKMQNSDKIYEFIQTQIENDALFQTNILNNRNIAWLPKIEKAVKEKSTFFAVGAGHLGGEKGVLNLLKAKGYKLQPIRF